MDSRTKTLIAKKMERARQDLHFAQTLHEQGGYRQAISRAYYAIFAAASASLLTQGITRKKHSGVEAAFNQHLAHPGLVERQLAVLYRDAHNARLDADYSDLAEFSQARSQEVLNDANAFVQHIEDFLRRQGVK